MNNCNRRDFFKLGTAAAMAGLLPTVLAPRAFASADAGDGLTPLQSEAAPLLRLPNLDGRMVDLRDFHGNVVLVNFWADWCPPCRHEIPSLSRAWIELSASDVHLLAVHVGGTSREITNFMENQGLKFPVLVDGTASTYKRWRAKGLPTTFVVGPDGNMAYVAVGAQAWDTPQMLDPILALVPHQHNKPSGGTTRT